jgi:hypothetical protein
MGLPGTGIPSDAASAIILRLGDVVCLVPGTNGAWTTAPGATAEQPHLAMRMTLEKGTTMVMARNGTHSALRYRARMQGPGSSSWQETSIIPVGPGLLGYETWPHPIDALAVSGISAAPPRSSSKR